MFLFDQQAGIKLDSQRTVHGGRRTAYDAVHTEGLVPFRKLRGDPDGLVCGQRAGRRLSGGTLGRRFHPAAQSNTVNRVSVV